MKNKMLTLENIAQTIESEGLCYTILNHIDSDYIEDKNLKYN